MKNNRLILLSVLSLCFTIFQSHAQDGKKLSQGKITFEITYPGTEMDEQQMAMMPSESVIYFNEGKSRAEIKMAMGQTVVISDHATGKGTMLMDVMGNKTAMEINADDVKKQKDSQEKPAIKVTDETKTIAGYTCKKAVVTMKTSRGESSYDVWFTKDLAARNGFSSEIEGIDGYMLEFAMIQNGMNMKMTATSVEAMEVADSYFEIPEGYTVRTMQDLQKMQNGGK